MSRRNQRQMEERLTGLHDHNHSVYDESWSLLRGVIGMATRLEEEQARIKEETTKMQEEQKRTLETRQKCDNR